MWKKKFYILVVRSRNVTTRKAPELIEQYDYQTLTGPPNIASLYSLMASEGVIFPHGITGVVTGIERF